MLPQTIVFTHARVTYTFTLRGRVSLLHGLSATGKTTFIKNITKPGHAGKPSNVKTLLLDSSDALNYSMSSLNVDDIVFLDEDAVRKCRELKCLNKLWNMPVYIVIACREPLFEVKLGYTDIYDLVTDPQTNRTKFVQHFPTYDTLPSDCLYFCEDAKSGFQYFSSRLPVAEPLCGCKNWKSAVGRGTLILDGSAIGQYMDAIEKSGVKKYLPVSFEYLLLRAINGDKTQDWEERYTAIHKSMERYYTHLCTQGNYLPLHYTKSKLNSRLYYIDVTQELRGLANKFHEDFLRKNFFYKLDKHFNPILRDGGLVIVDQMVAFQQLLGYLDCSQYYLDIVSSTNIWSIAVPDFNATIFSKLKELGAFNLIR